MGANPAAAQGAGNPVPKFLDKAFESRNRDAVPAICDLLAYLHNSGYLGKMGLATGVENYLQYYSSIACDMPMLHTYIVPVILRCIQEKAVTIWQTRGWLKGEGHGGEDFRE